MRRGGKRPDPAGMKGKDTMKKILVTGGAGFIGTNLCRRLLNEGQAVICADSFWTGRRENVADLLAKERFTLVEADVTAPDFTETVLRAAGGEGIGQIYHLACPASPKIWMLPIRLPWTASILPAVIRTATTGYGYAMRRRTRWSSGPSAVSFIRMRSAA